jgi:hypothetical protein
VTSSARATVTSQRDAAPRGHDAASPLARGGGVTGGGVRGGDASSGRRDRGSAGAAKRDCGGGGVTGRRLLAVGAGVGAAAWVASGAGAASARAALGCEARYLGYRAADRAQPYAKYMKSRVDPPQPHVLEAVARGPLDAAHVPPRSALAAELESPGYAPVETGFGRTANGEVWVACLTAMPRVTPEMWLWWFGWHSTESARYKLWHPEAHAYAALRDDRAGDASLPDRARFVGNVSYVDEVIGGQMDQLAISFRDPVDVGIDESRIDGRAFCGAVGTVLAPVNIGQVVHVVRRVSGGSEMRSRFYLNVPRPRAFDVRALACAVARGVVLPRRVVFDAAFGGALLRHCGEEMNHLAQFLPELHAEFS